MDRLHCMQVFVRVVEHGSFTRAAETLGISRAGVTDAVSRLEERVGCRLLNRTTRRVSVTDEGDQYYGACLRILDQITEAEDRLAGRRRLPQGRLRVSVPQSFHNAVFFPALAEFVDDNPQLEVEIGLTDRAVHLVEEGFDCAIRGVAVPPDADVVARPLSRIHWVTCAAPDYLAHHGRPQQVDELSAHNCLRVLSQSTGRVRDWSFVVDGAPHTLTPQGKLCVTSYDAAIQSALCGLGIVQVPDILAVCPILAGTLLPVLTDRVAPAPPLVFVHAGNRYLPAKVRVFREHICQAFPQEGWWPQIQRGSADRASAHQSAQRR